MSNSAWVTLTTNDTYSLGALVLAHSLRRAGTVHQLAVLVTPGVSESMREKLKDVYNLVQVVDVMDSQDAANLALLSRPELGVTFTKLHCWRLVQYEKCVFLDSDTLVLQNCDELFEREELSAAPDVSWPDCFNSGVFVFKPSLETFDKITEFALKNGSFDGGDQGLLNLYFDDWAHADIKKHLPFVYNVTAFASYCYLPAFKQFRNKIKILHFAGKMKPWLMEFNSETKMATTPSDYVHAADLIQLWWNIFCEKVHPKLTDTMSLSAAFVQRLYYETCYNELKQNYHQYHFFHHHHNQFNDQYQQQDYNYEVQEFHDPWEEYYEKQKQAEQNQSPEYQTNDNGHDGHGEHGGHDGQYENQSYHSNDNQSSYSNQSENHQHHHEEYHHHQEHDHHHHEEPQHQHHQHHHHHHEEPQHHHHHEEPHHHQHHHHNEHHQEAIHHQHDKNDDQNQNENQNQVSTFLNENKIEPESTSSHEEEEYLSEFERFMQTHYPQKYHQKPEKQQEQQQVDSKESQSNDSNAKETANEEQDQDANKNKTGSSDSHVNHNSNTAIPIDSLDSNLNVQKDVNNTIEVCISKTKTEMNEHLNDEAGLAGALSQLSLGSKRTPEQEEYEDLMRRQCWESGQIDYSGRDSFANIWKKISQTLENKPSHGDNKSGSA